MTTLFTLSIPSTPSGTFTCTQPSPKIYLLTFHSPPDNRLTTPFISTFLLALDILERRHPPGVLITTSSIAKFYSNGLDLDHVRSTSDFFQKSLYPLLARLLTFPMPTVALMNGHAFAGGLIVAMHHDYRFQNPSKGFLCLNEVLFGMLVDQPLMSAFREKVAPAAFRSLVLEGRRYAAREAVEEGLVDGVGGLEEAVAFVEGRDLVKMGASGVYRGMKENMYRRSLDLLVSRDEDVRWRRAREFEKNESAEKAEKLVVEWEASKDKAKL